jgi:hypothetical protein
MAVPEAWRDQLPDRTTVDLIPLVDGDAGCGPGWCTYPWGFDVPDVEVFCGGQNEKTVDAVAVWRQGFLVHFGFEPGPAKLNDAGKALLVNTIAYAARCADDRPVTRVVSPFKTRERMLMPREKARSGVKTRESLATWFTGPIVDELVALPVDQRSAKLREIEPFLAAGEGNRFEVDAALRAWNVSNRDLAFFTRCEEALRAGGDDAARATRLLARYVPEGPGAAAGAEAWTKWIGQHRAFVFFSDVGGFRWFVDPLAKTRGVPTAELRGASRLAKAR